MQKSKSKKCRSNLTSLEEIDSEISQEHSECSVAQTQNITTPEAGCSKGIGGGTFHDEVDSTTDKVSRMESRMQNAELQIQSINGTMSEILDRLKTMVTNANNNTDQ